MQAILTRVAIASALRSIDRTAPLPAADMEVRLRVYPEGTWQILTGSPDYDQDLRGACGGTSLPFRGDPSGPRFDAYQEARAIEAIEEVKDQIAESAEAAQ